jgi:hypothetical protein
VENCDCGNSINDKDYSKPTLTFFKTNLSAVSISMYGDMFNYKTLNGLYLSSNNTNNYGLTTLDLYSNVKSISARYPEVIVLPIEKYEVIQNYYLIFNLPNNLLEGNYDILYFNDAGYYKASNSRKFTFFTILSD